MTYFALWPRCARPFFDSVNHDPVSLLFGSAAVAGGFGSAAIPATAGLIGAAGAFSAGAALTTVAAGAGLASAAATLGAGTAAGRAGKARQLALNTEAAQARQNAGQERAAGQRGAAVERRRARLLSSRALARAAASGAGAFDPTVEVLLGDIGAEGEFRALTELFTGEERARSLETQAAFKVFEGGQERRAGDIARRISRFTAGEKVLTSAALLTTGGAGEGLSRYRFG